ncbi:MAG: hypothetical protein Q8K69_07560, partial [Bacteroidota bacterium]|nr:hypothetical protein [Bacteroidota bacterium]
KLKQVKEKMTFEIEMFRTYGTLDMLLKISVRHMNETAKDNALISETDYLLRYPLLPIEKSGQAVCL